MQFSRRSTTVVAQTKLLSSLFKVLFKSLFTSAKIVISTHLNEVICTTNTAIAIQSPGTKPDK